MARKINLSVNLRQDQANWLDEKQESNSELVRIALDQMMESDE